jgi:predicted AAA+ superfamily ATPase
MDMDKIIKRVHYTALLDNFRNFDLIKVITGIRRSGKSTLLKMYADKLLSEGVEPSAIHSINFELPDETVPSDWRELFGYLKDSMLKGKTNYIFLDEIQNILHFEKLIDGLYVLENTDVYITGSNATLLSSDLATLLSGRYVEISILPMSFGEYLQMLGIAADSKQINRNSLLNDYMSETSFPQGIKLKQSNPGAQARYLQAVYNTVIEKDIVQRYRIRNRRAFSNVLKYIAGNIGSPVSPNNIAKALKTDGQPVDNKTVEAYLHYLTDSFVLYQVGRFDIKGKQQLATQEKYYLVDAGLRNILLGKNDFQDIGHILENVVYLELLRRGNSVWTGKYGDSEVDFVTRSETGEQAYYQVAYTAKEVATVQRELRPFRQMKDNYPKYLLTTDEYESEAEGIKIINVAKWLLENGINN